MSLETAVWHSDVYDSIPLCSVGLSLGCSASDPVPRYGAWLSTGWWSVCLDPLSHMGDLERVPSFWLLPGPAPSVAWKWVSGWNSSFLSPSVSLFYGVTLPVNKLNISFFKKNLTTNWLSKKKLIYSMIFSTQITYMTMIE